ncbi:hypothetical protein F2P81_009712 [Scophthalmus maximus]|uniref:Uncharacterized protein n=1 Tax=Scophthalmus maximus TaxID=52904 RepID=A0A6A4SXI0_SCOMX|nr:hypothetical protein F2P81_009712 [Scophthalmus maximus]
MRYIVKPKSKISVDKRKEAQRALQRGVQPPVKNRADNRTLLLMKEPQALSKSASRSSEESERARRAWQSLCEKIKKEERVEAQRHLGCGCNLRKKTWTIRKEKERERRHQSDDDDDDEDYSKNCFR